MVREVTRDQRPKRSNRAAPGELGAALAPGRRCDRAAATPPVTLGQESKPGHKWLLAHMLSPSHPRRRGRTVCQLSLASVAGQKQTQWAIPPNEEGRERRNKQCPRELSPVAAPRAFRTGSERSTLPADNRRPRPTEP